MKRIKFIALSIIISLSFNSIAQTLDEAGAAFNEGIQFTQGKKYTEAAAAYEKTIKICKQIGDDAIELELKAEQQLPITYYNMAKGLYEAKKYSDAIPVFEKAAKYADQMGETKTAGAARTYVAGIYTALGNSDLKKESYDSAIEKYNKALASKPGYYKAYYGLGLVYKKQGNLPLMKESLDKAITMAGDDAKYVGKSKDAASSAYLNEGALALQGGKYSAAIENFVLSQEYNDTEPSTYYYLAVAYNGISKFDEAIASANKALEHQTADKSDIYFELGKSYEKKGDASKACDYYKKVSAGNNVDAAKYQMETVLKCQ